MLLQTIPSASVLLLLVTGVLSSESAIIDISYHNDTNPDSDIISIAFNESLPQPLPQTAAQPRNYVAYIPVPISDDEDEGDEYYDDDEEYYDDEEYGGVSLRCKEKLRDNVHTPEEPPSPHPEGTSSPQREPLQ